MELFYDTETSGFPSNKIPMNDPNNAWICQLGAVLSDAEKVHAELNILIKSDGREISKGAFEVHKISAEACDLYGVDEEIALNLFTTMINCADTIVCHNEAFDVKLIKNLIARLVGNGQSIEDSVNDYMNLYYNHKNIICTMLSSTEFCNLPGRYGKPKWPKLEELHEILYHKKFDNAHDAMADVYATRSCYYELKNLGIIK